MKKLLLFLLSICLVQLVSAQGDPPDACPPGDIVLTGLCTEACVVCEDFDGFVGNNELPAGAPWEAPPGFCAPGLHNTQWVGFVANSTSLSIAITVFNCQMNEGLQIGIYNTVDCTSYQLVSNCDPDVFENTTEVFNANNLIIGGIYFLVIDGYLGDICDFSIDVLAGQTGAPEVSGPSPLNGPNPICPGGTGTFTSNLLGASIYEWTFEGSIISYQSTVEIDFPANPGAYQVCVTASNPCYSAEQTCQTIFVEPLPLIEQSATICEGETFEIQGQFFSAAGVYDITYTTAEGCFQDLRLTLTVEQPEESYIDGEICLGEVYNFNGQPLTFPGFYSQTYPNQFGCDSTINLTLIVHQPGSELLEEEICQGDPPIIVAGQAYSQTGLYTIFTETTEGCDSTVFLRLDVYTPSTEFLEVTICEGEFYQVGFAFYDQPGVYQAMLQGQGGCDSTITVDLSVYAPETNLVETVCAGESFTIGNTNYSTTGMHTETLTSFNGCDSIVNLDLTVLPPISTIQNIEICDGESYTLGGTTYSTTGNYQAVFTSANNCDSTVYLNLDVLDEPETVLNEFVCADANFTVGNDTYTETGTYTNTFTANNGCDSTVVLNLTVGDPIETSINPSICDGEIFTVGSMDFDAEGMYTVVLTAANGCDSTVMVDLTVLELPETTFTESICEGETITLNGNTYDATGIYTEVLTATNGCDSTVTVDLTVIAPVIRTLNRSICTGQTFTVGTSTYDSPGSYTDMLVSVVTGCDSIVNLNLSVSDVLEETLNITLCEGESYTLGSTPYDATGSYQQDFVTSEGCDSIAYLNLTVNPLLETFLTESICDGETFTVGSSNYSSSGNYQNTFASAVTGCDSTVYLTLTVLDVPVTALNIDICDGETYGVGSSSYNATGTYQDVLTAVNGCDSIVNLNLEVLDVPVTALDIDICDGEIYEVGSSDYSAAGTYQDVLTAANGCDSIVNLTLEVLDVPETALTELICDGESFGVGSSNYSASGNYTDVLTAANGCDSIVTLALTVAPIPVTNLVASICDGGTYSVGSSGYTATGNYQDILISSVGCDSIVNLNLTVTDFYETNLVETICDGESVTVGPSTYSTTGVYTDNFISSDGCDSIVNLNLTVNPIPVTNLTEVICDGEMVTVGASDYITSGVYQDILTAATGCDSIVNLDLTVNSVFETNLTEAICDGESVTVGTSNYTAGGDYTDLLTASNGCDSVVNLALTVYDIPETALTETICFGDSYEVGVSSYNSSGTYQDILTAFTGCDSIVNLELTVTELIETNLTEVICFGDSYSVGSSTYEDTGIFQDILTAANGCDSIVNLDLTERALIETSLVEDICDGETYTVGSASFDVTGIYQETLTSVSTGCDSIVNLDLNVIELPETFLTEEICDGESVAVGSSIYTTGGDYQDILTAASGCDSIVYLALTVFDIPETTLTETICFGDSYEVGVSSYNSSGSYQDILTAFTGCDSIVNLELTVTELIETSLSEVICFGDTYSVGTSTYDATGVYQDILTAVNGCDSIVNLELMERELIETDLVADICDGETYEVGSASFNTTGIYQETLTSVSTGCDSIVNLDLNVIELPETFLTDAICDGESVTVGSSIYTEGGDYQDILTAASGCDSIVYLALTVYEIPETSLTASICDGETFEVGSSVYTETGAYTDVLTAFTGCDSIVSLDLNVIELPETFLNIEICDGETYGVGSSVYANTGLYEDVLTAASGCDSTVYLDLVVNEVFEVMIEDAICNGETFTVGSSGYDETGTYQDVLNTVSGCDSVVNLNLLVYPCQLELTVDEDQVGCNGGSDGSISFNLSVGTPPYFYQWESLTGAGNGTGNVSGNNVTETIENLAAGNYRITITDTYDIVEIITATVAQPTPVAVALELSNYSNYNTSCPEDTDGFITASPSGGTPPYTFAWSNNATSATADDLAAGTYTVTVTDQNNCSTTADATLIAPPPLAADFSTVDPACFGDETGNITVDTVMGGISPYLYSVDGRPFSSSNIFGGLGIGVHSVSVQDANGCIWEQDVTVNQPEELTVDLGKDIELKLGDSTQLFAQTSYTVDTFLWSFFTENCFGCEDPMVTPLRTGDYQVTVMDENGCTAVDEIRVFVNRPYDVFIPTAFSPNNDGNNDVLMIFAGDDVRQVKKFMVFNRWGEAMMELQNFQPNTPIYGWDGTHRGELMNSGVYVYFAEVEFIDGEIVLFKGDTALMR